MVENNSLWFEDSKDDSEVLDKIKSPKKLVKKQKKVANVADLLLDIQNKVYKILGRYAYNTETVTTRERLHQYIDESIKNGIIAIDTETNNSLDPLTCKIMGPCIYTYNQKQVYIPINHVNLDTREKLTNQLTEQDIREEFQRLVDNKTKIIFHNASFDIRVIQCTCGIELTAYWDTQIAARILNENELESNLKYLYKRYVDNTADKYDIESLFGGVEYAIVPPELFALYASTDAYKTLRLYDYQKAEFEKAGCEKLYKLFLNIEMPLVKVVKDMELRGIEIDQEYAKRLGEKYLKQIDDYQSQIDEELNKLKPQIDEWRKTDVANFKSEKGKDKKGNIIYTKSKSEQLEWPINLESPAQLAILLYDVLNAPVIDKKSPRGTSAEIMDQMSFSICKLINKRKKLLKLYRDFIVALPQEVNFDNRIHCSFNQCGTDTGRFSSQNPNLQQVPSHAKEIRMMFKASDGYRIVGSDYSGQEPKITAHMSQDSGMITAYKEKKDLYSVIASMSFGVPYEQCLEFDPVTHEKSVEGKERRSQAKSILLGLEYGRGATSIGEQINKSKAEAQEIIDRFFKAFPSVKKWIDSTHASVRKLGYVEDWYGRRRRLPNINLPEYLIEPKNKDKDALSTFNPFLNCADKTNSEFDKQKRVYELKLQKCEFNSQVKKIIEEADKQGIYIRSNSNLIAEAERQSVNSIIQGGAATLTKLAMINIDNDEELNRLGFKLLITIHDEVLGECPAENAERVADRLTQVMVDTAKPYMDVPMQCDPYNVSHWYEDEMIAVLQDEYEKLCKQYSADNALKKLIENHTECERDFILRSVSNV